MTMTMAFSLAADASLLALAVMTAAIRALHNAGRAVTSLASSVTFAVTSVPTVTPMATVAISAGSGSGLGDGSGVGAARLLETDEDDGEEDGRGGEGEDGLHVTVVVGVGVVVEEETMDD